MDWLSKELEKVGDYERVIINFHIYPGQYFVQKDQKFWDDDFLEQFKKILKKHKYKILIVLGAHTHTLDFRHEGDYYGLITTPSISPEFGNNPGFATFEVSFDSI